MKLGLDTFISELVPVRASNALEKNGYVKFQDLLGITEDSLLAIPNIGISGLVQLKKALRLVITATQQRQQAEENQLEREKTLARQHS